MSELEQIRNSLERQERLIIALQESSTRQHLDIGKKVDRIYVNVFGDKEGSMKGIGSRTEELEDYVEKDKLLKENIRGRIWGIVIIGGAIVSFGTSLLFWYITKH